MGTITVKIPKITEHAGYPGNLMTIQISDKCPKCGGKRATKRWEGLSYDGSRRLIVDCWQNECGHLDLYSEVREEYHNMQRTTTSNVGDRIQNLQND